MNIKHPYKTNDIYYISAAIILAFITFYLKLELLLNIAQGVTEIFLKFLQLMSAPIVFLAIVTNFLNISAQSHLKQYGKRVLFYTILTTILASTVAYLLFQFIHPADTYIKNIGEINTLAGNNFDVSLSGNQANTNYYNELLKLIPNNILKAFTDNNILGVALIAALMGVAMMQLPKKQQEPIANIFTGLFQTFINIARYIIKILPLGIWAFTVLFLYAITNDNPISNGLGKYVIVVIAANAIQGFIVLPLLLLSKNISPVKLFKAVSPALTTAFFSKSSSATLPLTIDCMIERNDTKDEIAKFALPICTIINMNGCAAFIYTTVLFVALNAGFNFSTLDYILWIFIATLVAIGNASIPMGCYFLSSAILLGMGVSLELMVLILPIYTIFDMIETTLNVWSDCCVTDLVANER